MRCFWKGIKLSTRRGLTLCCVPKEKLIYGDMITGHQFKEDLETRMLPFIFNIGKIAGRQIHFIPDFVAGFLFLVSCRFERLSKRRKIIFFDWSFCHIDSPYYILLFTFLSEYVYTIPIDSLYNSFFVYNRGLEVPL